MNAFKCSRKAVFGENLIRILLGEKPVQQVHLIAKQTRRLGESENSYSSSDCLRDMVKLPQRCVVGLVRLVYLSRLVHSFLGHARAGTAVGTSQVAQVQKTLTSLRNSDHDFASCRSFFSLWCDLVRHVLDVLPFRIIRRKKSGGEVQVPRIVLRCS